MWKTILPPALIVAALGPMAACSDIQGALEFSDNRDGFEDRVDRLNNRSNTAFSAIPDTGSSTYTGEATLAAGTRDDGIVLIGDATMTIDWGSSTLDGRLDNFGGFDSTREYSDYNGALTLEDGRVGVNRPNDLESQIVGTLTGEDHTLDVDAFWQGDLRGTPIRGAIGETSLPDSRFDLNGERVAGGIMIAVGG